MAISFRGSRCLIPLPGIVIKIPDCSYCSIHCRLQVRLRIQHELDTGHLTSWQAHILKCNVLSLLQSKPSSRYIMSVQEKGSEELQHLGIKPLASETVIWTTCLLAYPSFLISTLWATEPNRVVKSKKKFFFLFFDKNHYIYMGEGHFSPDPLGSSNFRASKQLKTAKNGLFWQFLPIWHSVDQFFG